MMKNLNALCVAFQTDKINRFLSVRLLCADSTKTIRLLAFEFYEMIVESGFKIGLINYIASYKSQAHNQNFN